MKQVKEQVEEQVKEQVENQCYGGGGLFWPFWDPFLAVARGSLRARDPPLFLACHRLSCCSNVSM